MRPQAVIDAAILLVGSSMCTLHVCANDPQGEDLLWRLQHEGVRASDGVILRTQC